MSKLEMSIRAARLIKGLSQDEIAKKLQVHAQTYRKWETNPDSLTIGNAKRIAKILDVGLDNIFFA